MTDCPHLALHPHVQNLRVTEVDGEPALHWLLFVTVHCAQCGCSFRFAGIPEGMSVESPTVAPDARTAHLPIVPVPRDSKDVN